MPPAPARGEVYWANLDPTVGREIRKKRRVLILSPDEMNRNLSTVIAAPITSSVRAWPTRCPIVYRGKTRSVALDQIRCLDVSRLVSKITRVDPTKALMILTRMFTP
jgi:mRNA interferase MazF